MNTLPNGTDIVFRAPQQTAASYQVYRNGVAIPGAAQTIVDVHRAPRLPMLRLSLSSPLSIIPVNTYVLHDIMFTWHGKLSSRMSSASVLYAFDLRRIGILLIGGEKTGNANW